MMKHLNTALLALVLAPLSQATPGGDSLLVEVTGNVSLNYFTTGILAGVSTGDSVHLQCEVTVPGAPVGNAMAHDIQQLYSSLTIGSAVTAFATNPWMQVQNDAPGLGFGDGLAISLVPLSVDELFLIMDLRKTTSDLWNSDDLSQLVGSYSLADFDVIQFQVLSGVGALEVSFEGLTISEPIVGEPKCFGDGSDQACPCGNVASSEAGCRNSTGAGAQVLAVGSNKVVQADLGFEASDMVPFGAAILFVGDTSFAGGLPFGDGLRCAGGAVKRLEMRGVDPWGRASWGALDSNTGGWLAGDRRHFQVWYYDPAISPCGAGFNTSNAVQVDFRP